MSRYSATCFLALTVILPVCLSAQPVMRVLNPSTHIVTSAATVSLSGLASANSTIRMAFLDNKPINMISVICR